MLGTLLSIWGVIRSTTIGRVGMAVVAALVIAKGFEFRGYISGKRIAHEEQRRAADDISNKAVEAQRAISRDGAYGRVRKHYCPNC